MSTSYRGLVLICSGKKPYDIVEVYNISKFIQLNRITHDLYMRNYNMSLTLGKAIAVGELVHCRKMELQDENQIVVFINDLDVIIKDSQKHVKSKSVYKLERVLCQELCGKYYRTELVLYYKKRKLNIAILKVFKECSIDEYLDYLNSDKKLLKEGYTESNIKFD